MSLPVKPAENPGSGDSSLSWAIQNTLLQQYGQIMLDRMLNKQPTDSPSSVSTSDVAGRYHHTGLKFKCETKIYFISQPKYICGYSKNHLNENPKPMF